MNWIKSVWNYIKTPDHFVGWVKAMVPSAEGYKYLPQIYYVLITILGLILLYVLFKILRFVFRKLVQVYMRIKAFYLKQKKKQLPAEEKTIKPSRWLKRLKEILNPEKEPIEEAFYESAKLLKQAFGGHEYMYELPWYLVLGDSNSGKSALLNDGLDIKRPFGLGPKIEPLGLPLSWHYFDYGVAIDVRGDVIYNEDKKSSTSKSWLDLLQQLSYHRARRPLDGIVVTVSAEDLYGPKKLSALDMRQKAHVLYQKLVMVQNNLSMRIPIYVVITKTDMIPGFDAFIKSFQASKLKGMFGWSAPHSIQQHYSPSWMEDAAQETTAVLDNLKLQAFTMMHKQENNLDTDALFVFTEEFKNVWENISAFVNQLFQDNVYKDSHFLRGVYFTGALEQSKEYTANLEAFIQKSPLKILFARDVFVEKIFRERNIACPSYEIVQSIWRNLTASKIGLMGGLAVSFLFAMFAHHQFRKSKENLSPVIQNVKTVMKEIKNTRANGITLTKDEIETYNKHFDHFLKTVTEETKFWAIFMPPSWFSNLKKDAYSALGAAFDLILVQSVHQQVQRQLNKLLASPKEISKLDETEKSIFDVVHQKLSEKANPIKTKYFLTLKEFTDNLVLLEKVATSYNNFFISRNRDDLFVLMKDLFGYDFNNTFKNNFSLYNWSIRTETYERLDLKAFKTIIQKNFEKLFDNFVVYGINQNDSLKKVFGLNALLDELADVDAYGEISVEDFDNIFKTIRDVIDISYKTGDLAWVAEDSFNPGEEYSHFLNTLKRSQLITKEFVGDQMKRIQAEYAKLKDQISGSYSTLLEASVYNMKGGVFSANRELIDIKNHLDRFSDEAFMIKVEKKGIATKQIPGKLILWDAKHLANADKLLSSYYDFMEKGIEDYPQKLRPLLERVAKAKLHDNLLNLLAAAQYTVSSSIETIGANPEERFKHQVRSFNMAWTPLKKILNELSSVDEIPEAVSELNRFVTEQFIKVLVVLEDIVEKENLLKVRDGQFKWWSGDGHPILLGFRVSDSRALESILETHFRRLGKLAKEYAKPSVNLLMADFLPLLSSERLLVRRWSSILEQSIAYEKKQAGNSVEKLIHLYVQELKEFKLATAEKDLKKIKPIVGTSDYFLELHNSVVKGLLDRLDVIGGYKVLESYQQIATYFNENIAGRYPFSNSPHEGQEVDLLSLRQLFTLMGQRSFDLEDYTNAFKNREQNPRRYIDFLKSLDVLRRLFKPFVDGKADTPSVAVQIYFDASKKDSPEAHQNIVSKEFDFDTGEKFTRHNDRPVWTYGDPISVHFILSDQSPFAIFIYQEEGTFTQLSAKEGAFIYDGEWALFRMLQRNADRREKGWLEFDVPVESSRGRSSMRSFIKVVLKSTDEKDPLTIAEFPSFPFKAPALSKKSLRAINALSTSVAPTKEEDDER